jgi:hypothetical protein
MVMAYTDPWPEYRWSEDRSLDDLSNDEVCRIMSWWSDQRCHRAQHTLEELAAQHGLNGFQVVDLIASMTARAQAHDG